MIKFILFGRVRLDDALAFKLPERRRYSEQRNKVAGGTSARRRNWPCLDSLVLAVRQMTASLPPQNPA